jgi:cytochrome P450 / NADPH-cytochrome P450 reductase
MHDIAVQLVLKWARQGAGYKIPVTEDFSRLTLDTIALCTMDFRFNSFYKDELHPYVEAMNNILGSKSNAGQISTLLLSLLPSTNDKLKQDIKYLRKVANDVVQHRRDNPTERHDLLNAMIYGKDPKTGKTMRDDLIAANMQTFLIAG